ncbi:MAG: hypothetical protein HQL72_02340 [Magnetococcales bacterium]|nr:hypothetical protein [Magnetococcales bacterium]
MPFIPFTNKSNNPVSIGGKTVWPGETRMVDSSQIPVSPSLAPAKPPINPRVELLESLCDGTVEAIEVGLAQLTDDELIILSELEAEGKNRVTALEAIQEEQQRRSV